MDLGYFVGLMGSTVWTEPSCHSGAEDHGAAILALKTLELPFWRYSSASLFTLWVEVRHFSFDLKPSNMTLLLARWQFSFIPSYTYLYLYLPVPTQTHPYTPIPADTHMPTNVVGTVGADGGLVGTEVGSVGIDVGPVGTEVGSGSPDV